MENHSNQVSQLNELLETQAPNFSSQPVERCLSELYGLSGSLSMLGSERDQNFLLVTEEGAKFVVRIANIAENPAIVDMQTKVLQHISQVDPGLPVPRVRFSLQGKASEHIQAENGDSHIIHVITYLPGKNLDKKPADPELLRPAGACLARLAKSLRGFFHPAAEYGLLWDIKHTAKLNQYVSYLKDAEHRQVVQYFLDRFSNQVLPILPAMRAQVVHNDLTPDNIVVAEDDPGKIVGIIDFGDMVHSHLITDLATTIASMIREYSDPLSAAVEITTAYHEITPLEPEEISLLYDLVASRLITLMVIAAWRSVLHPENEDYITSGAEYDWRVLKRWYAIDPADAYKRLSRACGFWELEEPFTLPPQAEETTQAHLARRARLLGPCYYLFYDRPLSIVRGQGVWLYDGEGHRYLDVYNNVAHVGHGHPHVLKAISQQSRRLNTSTRYMHGFILELAERISASMPDPLSVCMFVCTGTEANELAWRMAKLVSGGTGGLISKFSYHGNSDAIINFSTEAVPEQALPQHVQTIFPPTSNHTFPQPDAGIGQAIQTLYHRGHPPAMLILDSGFTSDGIYTVPPAYLSTLYARTRAAGGLCVADEVQAGFGRVGDHFWGFMYDSVVPDIVTMGKSMANGHPVAAVVTRPEIAAALAKDTGYFNTYGGNPVSCAAALAVLDVIEKEGLQQNARHVGGYLFQQLERLCQEYPLLGPPHGAGLLLGVDVIKDHGSPDPAQARRIMNHMREHGVLIGTTGQYQNTLKIRPPIVFETEHAELLLSALKSALDEL